MTEVLINGAPAELDERSGDWQGPASLSGVRNRLVVEALDQAGNRARRELEVFLGKPGVPVVESPELLTGAEQVTLIGTVRDAAFVEVFAPAGLNRFPVVAGRFEIGSKFGTQVHVDDDQITVTAPEQGGQGALYLFPTRGY